MPYTPIAEASSPIVGAGTKAQIAISNPTVGVTYTVAVHTQPIVPPTTVAPPNDWAYESAGGGPWAFLTGGGTWGGSETHFIATMTALLNVLKAGYGSQWTLSLLRLHVWNNTLQRYLRASPFPTVTAEAGTFGTNPSGATDPALGNVTAISLPTFLAPNGPNTKVGRILLRLPAWELNTPTRRVRGVTSSTTHSGIVTAGVTSLIGYLSGAATRIVGVNGGIADDIADVDCAPSPRIAREAGLIS